MKQINMSRENAYKLIELIRNYVEKDIDLLGYFENNPDVEKTELQVDFLGVSNGFLSEIIHAITGYEVEVYGDVEKLFTCPCCGFKTLTERFDVKEGTGYDICPYCNWEDDGTIETNVYRSINKGSIDDYRNNLKANFNRYYINKWFHQ